MRRQLTEVHEQQQRAGRGALGRRSPRSTAGSATPRPASAGGLTGAPSGCGCGRTSTSAPAGSTWCRWRPTGRRPRRSTTRCAGSCRATSARDERWWDRVLRDEPDQRDGGTARRHLLHTETDGTVTGYAAFRIKATWTDGGEPEARCPSRRCAPARPRPTRRCGSSCCRSTWCARCRRPMASADDPLRHLLTDGRALHARPVDALWVRLVDVGRALSARRYPAPIDLVFEVRDEFCPWNAGRWRLSGHPAGALLRPHRPRPRPRARHRGARRRLPRRRLAGARCRPPGRVTEVSPGAVTLASTAFGWPVTPVVPGRVLTTAFDRHGALTAPRGRRYAGARRTLGRSPVPDRTRADGRLRHRSRRPSRASARRCAGRPGGAAANNVPTLLGDRSATGLSRRSRARGSAELAAGVAGRRARPGGRVYGYLPSGSHLAGPPRPGRRARLPRDRPSTARRCPRRTTPTRSTTGDPAYEADREDLQVLLPSAVLDVVHARRPAGRHRRHGRGADRARPRRRSKTAYGTAVRAAPHGRGRSSVRSTARNVPFTAEPRLLRHGAAPTTRCPSCRRTCRRSTPTWPAIRELAAGPRAHLGDALVQRGRRRRHPPALGAAADAWPRPGPAMFFAPDQMRKRIGSTGAGRVLRPVGSPSAWRDFAPVVEEWVDVAAGTAAAGRARAGLARGAVRAAPTRAPVTSSRSRGRSAARRPGGAGRARSR